MSPPNRPRTARFSEDHSLASAEARLQSASISVGTFLRCGSFRLAVQNDLDTFATILPPGLFPNRPSQFAT